MSFPGFSLFLWPLFFDDLQGDYTQPKCGGKQVIVHLFEWSWDSIARECEEVM